MSTERERRQWRETGKRRPIRYWLRDDRPVPPVVPTFADWPQVYREEIERGAA